jgi:hypothetical protein
VFEWRSVLQFDMEFRKLQAESNMPWDSECSYLMTLLLRTSSTGTRNDTRRSVRKDPSTGKELCLKYNKGTCTSPSCRYAHLCMICLAPHPEVKHPKNG